MIGKLDANRPYLTKVINLLISTSPITSSTFLSTPLTNKKELKKTTTNIEKDNTARKVG